MMMHDNYANSSKQMTLKSFNSVNSQHVIELSYAHLITLSVNHNDKQCQGLDRVFCLFFSTADRAQWMAKTGSLLQGN